MTDKYDVFVIGGGPGGYTAAIRCAKKGASVGLAEKNVLGGVCLNSGCIPSKTLLASSHFMKLAQNADSMGIEISSAKPDWQKIQARKNAIIDGFAKSLKGLIQSHNIKIFQHRAVAVSPNKIKIEKSGGSEEIQTNSILIATGSKPIEIPRFKFDGKTIISSTEAMNLSKIPESMIIVGGGVIGCEMACIFAPLGTKVIIVELLPHLLSFEDEWVGKTIEKELNKLGVEILTGQKVVRAIVSDDGADVLLESGKILHAEKVLVAAGREAVCDKETIENLGLEMKNNAVKVNQKMQTSVQGVYAIGDVVGTTYLAHGAFAEAQIAASNAAGGNEIMYDYSLIPRVVYTFPEVGSVGKTQAQCVREGIDISVGKSLFKHNGRSVSQNETAGEVRVIKNKADNKILGVTIVGACASEMLSSARAILGSKENINNICFPHPTACETLKDAWEDALGMGLSTE
ncbi:MAG: dihydrolipoyl dehydrogenase [Phycisphaerae bacterium]